ncbi:hypothetical protein MIND_00543400 [Mycena indigotica]|uniref:Uncharacterized protein n=1 Tax=Mycena indigotica TaxID=2126181 RepID=A0A8H6SY40_9AGAR|nr:uncharacterized protein MIND_00543400 [Mycena indigotica]KAF7307489.1 hypothetical protein MIND_00543400 [Mycena indigotica]
MLLALGCSRRLARPPPRRWASSAAAPSRAVPSFFNRKRGEDEDDEEASEKAKAGDGSITFPQFLIKFDKFRLASPRNWLAETENEEGQRTSFPFPMNPSFKPPPPISDQVRSYIYELYIDNPETNNIRVLSQRFHISLKRVEAILRLKGLEAAHVKGKPLQTGFQWGMEKLLGVKTPGANYFLSETPATLADEGMPERVDVDKADMLEQLENRDAARQRFQRQYWESVVDDGRASLSLSISGCNILLAIRSAERALKDKSNPRLMPRFPDTPTIKSPRAKVQIIEKEGKLPVHFVDVGGRFIEVHERERRMVASRRRRALNAKESSEKVLQGWIKARTRHERARRHAVKKKAAQEKPQTTV